VPAAVWANAKVEVKTTTDRRLGIPRFMILSNLRLLPPELLDHLVVREDLADPGNSQS
jgi:hypothetical protein